MTGLSFMGYVALFLLGIGLFASLVGFVALLVAGFRRNVRWGFANLFIPGASIVFAILPWAEAKRGFLLQVVGLAVLALGTVAANDDGSSQIVRSVSGKAPETAASSESALKAKEAERSAMEQQLAALQAKLNQEYATLKARRGRLGTDPTALAAFNRDAAAYAASKTELSIKAGLVAQLRADEVRLTDQVFLEARRLAKVKPAPGSAAVGKELETTRVAPPKL